MTNQERLAAADANLSSTRRQVRRSPESLAAEHLLEVARSQEKRIAALEEKPAKAAKAK